MGMDSQAATACWRAHSWDWNWEYPNANLNCVQSTPLPRRAADQFRSHRNTNSSYNMKHPGYSSLEGSRVVGVLFDPSEELVRDRSSPAR